MAVNSGKTILIAVASAFTAACAATLVYGSVGVANRLVLEKRTLRLPSWPASKAGYRIGFFADLHLRDKFSVDLARRAVEAVVAEKPNICLIGGDFVAYYKPESKSQLEEALEPLSQFGGHILAIPGNHDYWEGDPRLLEPWLNRLGITLLRNEAVEVDGICWVGIDSYIALAADPFTSMLVAEDCEPKVVLWHEPDAVDLLPEGAALMLSGHSHGGQFRFPWGWTPMHTKGGQNYVEGFYPDAPTPLYVTRGIGTTGPPSRLGVLPEVAILTLQPAQNG